MQLPDSYEHHHPTKIIAGQRAVSNLPFEAGRFGAKKPLIVLDEEMGRTGFIHLLEQAFADCGQKSGGVFFSGERATAAGAGEAAEFFRRSGCDCFIAVGGGAVMDGAKAAAMAVALEGAEFPSDRRFSMKLPKIIAVPVTYAPGYQVTNLAELFDEEKNRPLHYFSENFIPCMAVLDPKATLKASGAAKAAFVLEALARGLEAASGREANPIVVIYAKAAIGLVKNFLGPALNEKRSREADQALASASLYAGIAFSGCSGGIITGAAHGLKAVRGIEAGMAAAVLLTRGLDFVAREMRAPAAELVAVRESLSLVRGIPGLPRGLREAGVAREQLEKIAEVAQAGPFLPEDRAREVFTLLEEAF